jgi:protein tyrosine phosphatase (PTP) superfamily phosphohydrolase (DUF442 family)
MNYRLTGLACLLAVALTDLAGCCHPCRPGCMPPYTPVPDRCPPPGCAAGGCTPAHPLSPTQVTPIPGPAFPPPSPPGAVSPPAAPIVPPPPVPLPPAPSEIRTYPPPATDAWRPGLPEASTPGAPGGARLSPPEGAAPIPPTAPPAVAEEGTRPTPSLPVGIRQFAVVKDKVASGLKPLLDGLDWLQANGYRAVLHVRRPGEDDAADRRQVEKRGLRYLSLEVSGPTLTPTVVDAFNQTVADPSLQPLFVYDKDGTLAGAMWYLHFRNVDRLGDAEARAKAARLGLRENGQGEAQLLWLAIQNYLSKQVQR